MTKDDLLTLLKDAIAEMYREAYPLLNRKGVEQAAVFRIGLHMNKLFNERFSRIIAEENLSIDSEYNKNGIEPKRIHNSKKGIRPDLIIHKRSINNYNKIAIEFKGYWNKITKRDKDKLKDLTRLNKEYRYSIGVLVILGKEATETEYHIFENGQEI